MPWTAGGVGAAGRFPGGTPTQIDPEFQPWLDLLDVSLEEPADAWSASIVAAAKRATGVPYLHGAQLALNAERAKSLVRRLAEVAGVSPGSDIDACAMIRAALERDDDAMTEMAERSDVSEDAFALLAQVATMPAYRAAARASVSAGTSAWQRGYCPVCGAWPSLAEIRGLEKERHLRCGACSADWALPLLRCAFCDETDHEKLGSLSAEGEEHLRRVETCESCHGYLKAVTTFDALDDRAVLVADIVTVALDLVAQDRGYSRPSRPGWAPVLAGGG